jgi:hypothetical protein
MRGGHLADKRRQRLWMGGNNSFGQEALAADMREDSGRLVLVLCNKASNWMGRCLEEVIGGGNGDLTVTRIIRQDILATVVGKEMALNNVL